MRHALGHRKFCRSTSHRLAMLNNLAISLINHEQIITTLPKAKELRPYLERLVTMARNKNTLHSRRILLSRLKNGNAVDKLFAVFAGRYKDRNGGYLRIVKNRLFKFYFTTSFFNSFFFFCAQFSHEMPAL